MPSLPPNQQRQSTEGVIERYNNHKITRIIVSRPFGSTGLCSYRVRGVDSSCAEHLTVESYTVIYAANSHTYYYRYSITHSLFHSRVKTFLFRKSFPPQLFLFFFGTDYMDSPNCLLLLLSIFRLLLFSFFPVLHFLVVGSVR